MIHRTLSITTHKNDFRKRRSKQVAAGIRQPSAISQDKKMIDKRLMATDELQFDIRRNISSAAVVFILLHLL